ncbi:MAG: ABC transporter ATP-binding protein [Nitrosomonas sp.]|nr:ABC transporter ATP-binding protein [Nitrosomonas sp.]MBK7365964.1 ABC transporter ATP-binding protein [Nitrosomonas sp.]
MTLKPAILAHHLSKCYQLYAQPQDRLKQLIWGQRRQYYRELWALREIDLAIMPGEVIGIVGRNGSGKSTLLQLICGTLTPTTGDVQINGRLAALLELGAGFNPEFTGRENIWMNAAIIGLTQQEIADRIEQIIDFSEIRPFVDQPVKTYSSGMYVRLAFSIAISVDPDILIIDEALSVGDGAFARKSFNRIMQLRDSGKTILFCSHSLFQIESLCNRAFWINQGKLMAEGDVKQVVTAYQQFLDLGVLSSDNSGTAMNAQHNILPSNAKGYARLESVIIEIDGAPCEATIAESGQSTIQVDVKFSTDPSLPCPTVAVTLHSMDGRVITSAASWEDNIIPQLTPKGIGEIKLLFEQLPLLKGEYLVSVYLLCEQGIHLYDSVYNTYKLRVQQQNRLQGFFMIPHQWK